jgi:hypothetical protein
MCGGVLRYYGGTAFYACGDAVLPRMHEIPGENVGLGWRGCVHCLINPPGCGFMGSWDSIVSSGFERLYGLGTALLVVCLHRGSVPPSVPVPTYARACTMSDPNLSEPKNPPIASTCDRTCPFPACIAYGGGGSRVGSGPASEHQNRPHPSGGGDIVSRPYAFWVLRNTRIARQRRRVPPVRIRGGSAVFLSKVHSQRITVGGRRR